jgi:transcriptional regulator of acetoin/glycerol metabolism
VRVIAATHRDLHRLVQEGAFRADLYYRLNIVPIHVPPLRERPEDIPILVRHFSELFGREGSLRAKRFSPAALEALSQHRWKGNIRELRNTVERLLIMTRGEVIDVPEREVEVDSIELLDLDAAAGTARLRIACGSGTYVRSLVRDVGEALGCGAHVAQLRRLWVDPFREPAMVTLDQLIKAAGEGDAAVDALLLPIEAGLAGWPEVRLDALRARRLGQGQFVDLGAGLSGEVHVRDDTGRSLGIGEIDATGVLRPKRLFSWASVQG